MEQLKSITAALDIGSHTVSCIIGGYDDEHKIVILASKSIRSVGIRRGQILNIDQAADVIDRVIQETSAAANVDISKVYVNINGYKLYAKELVCKREFPETKIVSKEDIQSIRKKLSTEIFDGEHLFHLETQEFILDGDEETLHPVGAQAKVLESRMNLILGPEQYQKNLELCLDRNNYTMVRAVCSPIASSVSTLSRDEKEAGVALIDFGAETTSIAIYKDEILRYCVSIPFGGNIITNDIKSGCSIIERHAEKMKTQFGAAIGDFEKENEIVTIPSINGGEPKEISFKSLAYIIQARLEEIIDNAIFHIDRSGYREALNAGIVISGGGAQLKNINALVEYRSGIHTRIGFPRILGSNQKMKGLNTPQFSTLFGLLQYALNDPAAQNTVEKKKNNSNEEKSFGFSRKIAKFFEIQ